MNKHYQIEQVQIQSKSIIDMWGEDVLNKGYGQFTPIADNLTLYFNDLKLTSKEYRLIATVLTLQRRNIIYITDKKIDPSGSNFKKARKSLKEKKYLETKRFMVDTQEGRRCLGTIYNFDGLKKRIVELAIKHDELKEKENITFEKSEATKNNNSKSEVENISENITMPAENKADTTTQTTDNNLMLNNFLIVYCDMHKELLNIKLDLNKQTRQKKYIVEIFVSIEKKKLYYRDVLDKARGLFEKVSDDKRTSLSFQDTVARAVLMVCKNKTSAKDLKANNIEEMLNKK